jgi:TonB family protein
MRSIRSFLWPLALLIASPLALSAQEFQKPDTPPVPLRTPPPQFPGHLKSEKISGIVTVAVVIDEKGAVTNAEINKSSHPGFETPSLEAVRRWRFTPAMKDDRPIAARVILPIHFREES